jgi:predicted PhzF superfamily epimerase YddE/YHI9
VLHVLRVFTGPGGEFGNPLGVVLDGEPRDPGERQAIATDLGYSETVFVDDIVSGELRIFTPAVELPFAGHPMVGTAWLLGEEGNPLSVLRPPAGEVSVRREDGRTWIAGRGEWAPDAEQWEMGSAQAVDEVDAATMSRDAYCWAGADEGGGVVRARGFFPAAGIVEDEATGSAALALCVALGTDIEVRQGRGSVIHARHLGDGRAEVGGEVVLDEVRELP